MNPISDLFQQAQPGEAAYADFSNYPTVAKALEAEGMGATQATALTTQWRVIDQYTPTGWFGQTWLGTSFSATLFQNVDTGAYNLSIRGSTGLNDFMADSKLLLTDGIAVSQVVALYNDWKSLTTRTNTYQAAKLAMQSAAR